MNNHDLKPQNFRKIAAEIVKVCQKETKGKAKLDTITNVLRKKAGFQSMQTLENFVEKENKKLPYDFIKTEDDLHKIFNDFSGNSYHNKSLIRYFKNLFNLEDEVTHFSIADDGAYSCFCFDINNYEYNVYILNCDQLKKRFINQTDVSKEIVMKDEFFVYIDSMKDDGIFSGVTKLHKNFYSSAKTFTNALTEAIKLIKALTDENLELSIIKDNEKALKDEIENEKKLSKFSKEKNLKVTGYFDIEKYHDGMYEDDNESEICIISEYEWQKYKMSHPVLNEEYKHYDLFIITKPSGNVFQTIQG